MIHTPFEGKWQNEPNMHCRSKAAADIEPRFVCQACGKRGAILGGSEPSLMG
jgi:hypothetical protein